jgi:hypothetical protein
MNLYGIALFLNNKAKLKNAANYVRIYEEYKDYLLHNKRAFL